MVHLMIAVAGSNVLQAASCRVKNYLLIKIFHTALFNAKEQFIKTLALESVWKRLIENIKNNYLSLHS